MKKIIILAFFTCLGFTIKAQTNVLEKTSWQIEKVNTDGSATFKKTASIKFPEEQPKNNFLQFDEDKNFHTGNDCFHMMGKYNVYENNQIEISEGISDMVENCKEPKTFVGTFTFKINKDRLELIPVKN